MTHRLTGMLYTKSIEGNLPETSRHQLNQSRGCCHVQCPPHRCRATCLLQNNSCAACHHHHHQDVRKYKLGLYFALRFYLAMQQQQQEQPLQDATAPPAAAQSGRSNAASSRVSGSSGLTPRQSLGGFARSEGLGAEPQQLEQWLLSLVLGHATATLQDAATAAATGGPAQLAAASGAAGGAAVAPAAVVVAAEACVCTCLLLSRTDVLFGRVFALFAQKGSGQAAGALGALMETVELAVLSDLVQGLAPEVMQVRTVHLVLPEIYGIRCD